jgi:cobalt-zinc-cadmium efflux system membrane fusion protein
MRHRWILLALILAGASERCGSSSSDQAREPGAAASKAPASADGTIRLTSEQVRASGLRSTEAVERTITPVVVAVGRVKARAGGEAQVSSPFPGRLIAPVPLPHMGEVVMKGQRMAEVEQQFVASERLQVAATASELQTSLDQAQRDVELKRTEWTRAQQLYDGGAIPQKQLQVAEFDLRQAEAKLEGVRRSKAQYDDAASTTNSGPRRAPIDAPIAGTIISADATSGEHVDPTKTLWTIADLRTVWVEAAVHEPDLVRIAAAKDAQIVIPGTPTSFLGTLVAIGSLVDPQNRTAPVVFSIDNRQALLRLEMFIDVRIPAGPPVRALVIPSSAVLSEGGASSVYVEISPGVYRRQVVTLGDRPGDVIAVIGGLKTGEKVVSVGTQVLRSESLKSEIPAEGDDKH